MCHPRVINNFPFYVLVTVLGTHYDGRLGVRCLTKDGPGSQSPRTGEWGGLETSTKGPREPRDSPEKDTEVHKLPKGRNVEGKDKEVHPRETVVLLLSPRVGEWSEVRYCS